MFPHGFSPFLKPRKDEFFYQYLHIKHDSHHFYTCFSQFFLRFHKSLFWKNITQIKNTDFPLTRLEGIMSKLKVTNAAYLYHKTSRMHKKVWQYSDQIKPRSKVNKFIPLKPTFTLYWNHLKNQKLKKPKHNNLFLIKEHNQKQTKWKAPDKKEQKVEHKKRLCSKRR